MPANPNLWRVVDGKLYLNITPDVVDLWENDIPGNLTSSTANWVSLDPKPAARSRIPKFKSAAPN